MNIFNKYFTALFLIVFSLLFIITRGEDAQNSRGGKNDNIKIKDVPLTNDSSLKNINSAVSFKKRILELKNNKAFPQWANINSEDIIIVSPENNAENKEQIEADCSGRIQLYGFGKFEFLGTGELLLNDDSDIEFANSSTTYKKEKSDDIWKYSELSGDFSLSGNKIEIIFNGEINRLSGSGAGIIMLEGSGGYKFRGAAETIPKNGVCIEFGNYDEEYKVYILEKDKRAVPIINSNVKPETNETPRQKNLYPDESRNSNSLRNYYESRKSQPAQTTKPGKAPLTVEPKNRRRK